MRFNPKIPQQYAYQVGNGGDWYHFSSDWLTIDDIGYIVQDAAQDYHDNHDGYEDSWPIKLTIAIRCHSYSFEVHREFHPDFEPVKIPKQDIQVNK